MTLALSGTMGWLSRRHRRRRRRRRRRRFNVRISALARDENNQADLFAFSVILYRHKNRGCYKLLLCAS